MAIVFTNQGAQVVLNNLDTDLAGGTLELQTSGDVEVATVTLAAGNIFTTVSGKIGTFASTTSDASATGGVVSKFTLKRANASAEMSGTVTSTGGGGDIEIEDTNVTAGTSVNMSAGTPITITIQ